MDRRILTIAVVAILTIGCVAVVANTIGTTGGKEDTSDNNPIIPNPVTPSTPAAKSASAVALTLASSSVDIGESMHASGQLTGTSGISGATVTVKITKPDGSVTNPTQGSSVKTDSSGKFSVNFTPSSAGAYMFSASFAGDDEFTSSSAQAQFSASKSEPEPTPVQCEKPWPAKIDMIDVPTSMVAGQTYEFRCQMFVRQYDTYCHLLPWTYGLDAPIEWTFTNANGISVSVESTTSVTDGIASVEFPCYMAGQWSVTAHWAGNAKYMEVNGHTSVKATGNTVYWNGFWITVEKWYKTADPSKYPNDFGWDIGYRNDPAFVLLKVKNAQDVINTNLYLSNFYITDTAGQAYSGMQGSFIGTNAFTNGLAPGAEAKVWVCFWIPNEQSLVINGMYGVVSDGSGWYYQDYGYLGPTSYNVRIPLPAESPA